MCQTNVIWIQGWCKITGSMSAWKHNSLIRVNVITLSSDASNNTYSEVGMPLCKCLLRQKCCDTVNQTHYLKAFSKKNVILVVTPKIWHAIFNKFYNSLCEIVRICQREARFSPKRLSSTKDRIENSTKLNSS